MNSRKAFAFRAIMLILPLLSLTGAKTNTTLIASDRPTVTIQQVREARNMSTLKLNRISHELEKYIEESED